MGEQNNMDGLEQEQLPELASKRYLLGRTIIMVLIVAEFFFGIVNFTYDRSFLSFTLVGCLLVALFYGATWVRTLFVMLYALIACNCLYVINQLCHQPVIKWIFVTVFAVQFCYSVTAGLLLQLNKGVKEYLFAKRSN